MEALSGHRCEGSLCGYLPTGRSGRLASYAALASITALMVSLHAKRLRSCYGVSRRAAPASFVHWPWTADDPYAEVAVARAGDVPTIEALAAAVLLRARLPNPCLRLVDLMAPPPPPRDLDGARFDVCSGTGRRVSLAFYGHLGLAQELTNRRAAHSDFHVLGYGEHVATTTPFDTTVRDGIDRDGLARDVAARRGHT